MKKIFVDTNIVIDLLSRRAPFFEEAAVLFSLADKKQIELTVSSLTIANTGYTLLRQMDSTRAKSVLRKLRLIVNVLPLDDKIVGLALNDGQELIITRNLKDFKNSKLPVMTAKQFIETIE